MGQGAGSCYGPDAINCPIFVNYPNTPPTLSFSGSPTTINSGASATLTWSSPEALYCESPDFAVPAGATYTSGGQTFTWGATSGSVAVSPSGTKIYHLTCTSLNLGDPSNAAITKSVTITVNGGTTNPVDPFTPPTADPGATGFQSSFQVDNNEDHNVVVATVPVANVDLLPGDQTTISIPYLFPSAGDWWIRACGDLPPQPNGIVSESNETNNCGPWTKITVVTECTDGVDNDGDGTIDGGDLGCASGDGTEAGDATVDLVLTPTTVRPGGTALLTWHSTGATSCTGSGFSTSGAINNATGVQVTPTEAAKNYSINCNGATDIVSATITNPSVYITAEPTLVDAAAAGGAGGTTNLKWSASEVTSCDIKSSQGPNILTGAVPTVGATTTTQVTGIKKQTTYTLSCNPLSGSNVEASVLVNILANFEEF